MSSNEHYETAARLLSFESDPHGGSYIDPNTHNLLSAQAEASLALAHEQRTANLIAVFGHGDKFLGERTDGYRLAKQIRERLDIE
ncbi:hypothetical protein SEA_SAKAI_87 [Arthrobacter phage Sakai]|nr:hypothetical protein SEA_GORPY_88 [Arthrobacter phage Gorpy]UVK62034.1 hypothetical protein SEA_SAKAI_87 [Arthrobacter phage Sakai]